MDDREGREKASEVEPLTPGLLHEMRHPLMGVLAGLELVARRMPAVTALHEWQIALEQAKRLDELFRTYRDLFAGAPPKPEPFAVDETVKRVVSLLSLRLRKLGDRFSLDAGAAPVRAMGGAPALVHALTNLIANALDALEEKGGTGRLQVRIVRANGRVEVRVSDEGGGIPPEVRTRLFHPRFTTKPKEKGTGLGLYLARTVIERAGGAVRLVEDGDPFRSPWARTEFCIELPACAKAAR